MPITFKEIEHIYSENTPFSYHALKGVNLKIKDKSFTAIIGQTGSGKSTLIQHINALLLPTSGEINVDEFIITATDKPSKLKPLRKKAGLVFQFPEYQLFEETIEKDIIFGPMNFGQKRRVAIAGILAMDPDILILDEPTAGLDPQGTNEMMSLFKKINDLGKTIILITHDMNHVLQYCDEVVVMNHGRVEKHDSVTNIFKDSNYLNSLGIDLPIITDFILKLNNHGFNIDSSINNIDHLVLAIGGEING